MIDLIFKILCGCLYLVGLPFGWSYQTTSIVICIYLWSILCTLTTFPILWESIRKHKWVIAALSLFYTLFCIWITVYFTNRYSISDPNAFMNCMIDLDSIAKYVGTSYELLNILIYVVAFVLIQLFNYLCYKKLRKETI